MVKVGEERESEGRCHKSERPYIPLQRPLYLPYMHTLGSLRLLALCIDAQNSGRDSSITRT